MSYKDDLEILKNRSEKENTFFIEGISSAKPYQKTKVKRSRLYVDLNRIKKRNKVYDKTKSV